MSSGGSSERAGTTGEHGAGSQGRASTLGR
jgi:hypothetical protein